MRRCCALSALLFVLSAPAVFADKPRGRLTTYTEDASEVRDLNRRPSKVKVYTEVEEQPATFEFPWKQVLGALLSFSLAAPFAWMLFRNVNDEIAASKEGQKPGRVRRKAPAERPASDG
ncbi:MAG: hypothetical protein INH41_01720 [Myxococcaceae bacterium]|nr:hypothetical protein [Myxococcaceae bacterium]